MEVYLDNDEMSSYIILWQKLEGDLPNLNKQNVLDLIFSHQVVYDIPLEDFNPDEGYNTKFPIFTRNALTFFHRNGFSQEFQKVLSQQRNLEKAHLLTEKLLQGENIEGELSFPDPQHSLVLMIRDLCAPLYTDVEEFHKEVFPSPVDYPLPSVEELGTMLRIYRYLGRTASYLRYLLLESSLHCSWTVQDTRDKIRTSIFDYLACG